jgi:hypothetical protein
VKAYVLVAALLTVGVAGCGKPSPIEESRDALLSWSASVEMAASAWLASDVPARYLGDLLSATADGLQQERAALAKAPSSPSADSLQRVEQSLVAAVERMRISLKANDRARVRAELDLVKSLGASLRRDTVSSSR